MNESSAVHHNVNDAEPRGLRLFLDSAEPRDWERLLPLGLFRGVTTNPLLLERAGQECSLGNLERLAALALEGGAAEIHLQTWGADPAAMTATGRELGDLGRDGLRVLVKVPATPAGFRAAAELQQNGCEVTITAVYTPGQVLAAAGLGAAYAAPYLGRLEDAGRDGWKILATMRKTLVRTGTGLRLLAASLRSAETVIRLARRGFDTLTFGAPVAEALLAEELTTAAAVDFQRAAEAMAPRD